MHATAYDQLAELEESHWWFRGRRAVCMELIRQTLGSHFDRVLDLGAGVGGFLPELERISGQLTHTDIERGILQRCSERGFVGGVQALGAALPLKNDRFDLVCMFDVIEHIADDAAAIAEVRRVLKPGAAVFLHVPAHPLLYAQNDALAGHHRRYTAHSLRTLLTGAGFRVQRLTHTNCLLFPAIAPTVLVLKLLERLRRTPRTYTNLSWTPPRALQSLFYELFRAELALSRHVDLPLGHSLAAIATLPTHRAVAAPRSERPVRRAG